MSENSSKHTQHPTQTPHTIAKKQKPLSLIVLITFVLLIVGFGGVYLIKSSTSEPEENTSEAVCQYDKDVCAFLEKLQRPEKYYQGPFTASILTTNPDGSQARIIIKSNEKGNYDVISYKENILEGETILMDNIMYTRNVAANTWSKSPNTFDPTVRGMKRKALEIVNKSGPGVTYTLIGDSKCGKKTCFKYELTTPTSGDTKTYVLFTQTQHMLKEVIMVSPDKTTTDTLFVYANVHIDSPPTE